MSEKNSKSLNSDAISIFERNAANDQWQAVFGFSAENNRRKLKFLQLRCHGNRQYSLKIFKNNFKFNLNKFKFLNKFLLIF